MKSRYIVTPHTSGSHGFKVYRVYDTEKRRHICGCVNNDDATAICKAMNISNSWEPILTRHEMGEGKTA